MNENTRFIYENAIGRLVFEYNSLLWITDVDGMSSVEIDIAESRSTMQIGSSITAQSVRPRSFTIDGAIFEPIATTRERVIDIIAPQIPATLTIEQNGESWYLDVVPEKTPEITPGNGVQFFQTRLHAAYPYWRTTASYATQVAGLMALFKFPFFTGGSWWISRYSDSYFNTIENRGNVPVEFRVVFTARSALENPEIFHIDTGKRILIRKSMIAGERVVVSTIYGQKGVTCISAAGEITNGFKYLSVDSDLSMTLIPGSNLLRIDAGVNREGLGVRIEAPEGVKSGV
ncbi:phage tail family protein [Oscillospiraceae bacterium OttesenSCG-928-G22]|nr:phage tail family protein [Oscillospiraceae bacterium OttesenSCG-928-G22]